MDMGGTSDPLSRCVIIGNGPGNPRSRDGGTGKVESLTEGKSAGSQD